MSVKEVIEWNAKQIRYALVFTVDGVKLEGTTYAENAYQAKQKPAQWFVGPKVRVISVTKI